MESGVQKDVIHVLDVSSWHGIANDHARVPVPLVDQWINRIARSAMHR